MSKTKNSIDKNKEQEQAGTPDYSLEEAFDKIEETIACLEDENITLEASFRAYQAGMKLLKYCNEKIDRVEKQVLKINEDGELDEF